MTMEDFSDKLQTAVKKYLGSPGTILDLIRLTGGATKQTWSFDAILDSQKHAFILQLSTLQDGFVQNDKEPQAQLPRLRGDEDAAIVREAAQNNVPVPKVQFSLKPEDGLGYGVVTNRIEGESLGRRINQDPRFAEARTRMADQCGDILAKIHQMVPSNLSFLIENGPAQQIAIYREILDSFDHPQPALELGFRWALDHLPSAPRTTVVHGDFRNGNFIVGDEGIRAVLDWEICHLGDPLEDLGWLCVKTWRFGGLHPVGGFGNREDLFASYERSSGFPVDPQHVHFWEAFGCIKWSIMCMMKGQKYLHGGENTVESSAIGRRMEEPIFDFLNLVYPRS